LAFRDYNSVMRLPLWLKIGWTIWLLVWAPAYWVHYGAQNFLYFCDLGNLLIGAALWLESPLLFSWAATGVLVFQLAFTVDLVSTVLFKAHWIGGTEYMFDASLPLWVRLLGLFHVVTPPLLLWAIKRLGYDERGWRLQTLMTWMVAPINYFWRPQYDVNWTRGPNGHEQHFVPGPVYLLAYLIVIPCLFFGPAHIFLRWWARRDFGVKQAETGL
jgi:hypothetical protein